MSKTTTQISDLLKKAIGLPPTSGCCGGPTSGARIEPQPPAGAAPGCCGAANRDESQAAPEEKHRR